MKRKWSPDEVKAWYERNSAFTYANRDDANIVVRKPHSLGWTVNWANPYAYLLQAGILAIVFGIVSILI